MTPRLTAAFLEHLDRLEQRLADGRAYLGGAAAGHADLANYQLLWFQNAGGQGGAAKHSASRPGVAAWAARVAAIGHGLRTESDAEAAIAAARAATPAALDSFASAEGFQAGQRVTVRQEGTSDAAVEGRLANLTDRRISLLRSDPEAGDVAVHFPRAGQILEAV